MNIPKYVINTMKRAEYYYEKNITSAGYTVEICKESHYTQINTFRKEIDKLIKWAEKNNAECILHRIPTVTRHSKQYAVVTIFDPVMQQIERYIA